MKYTNQFTNIVETHSESDPVFVLSLTQHL